MWCCEGTNGKDVVFTRKCVRYALRNYLGWHWGKIKPRKTKGDLDRRDVIAAYLRDFGRALKLEREGHAVLVYTDESYLHQNHCPGNSWISKDKDGNIVDRVTSKGRRLIMLHAITKDGPLVTMDDQPDGGYPIETLQWKASERARVETDTPHPIDGEDGKALTAELLWVAQSHSGDYHDNVRMLMHINSASCTIPDSFSLQMNSDMYLRWVKNRLLPTFEKLYPGKQMILIQDNVSKECALCSAVLLRCAATSDPLSHTRPTLLTGAVPPQARGRWAGGLHEQEVAVRAPGERRVRGEENQAAQARVEEAGRGA